MALECGVHADAARAREATLVRELETAAEADRAATPIMPDAYRAAVLGRKRLDAIGAEIESAVANQRAPALNTPAGARQFSGFLTAKTQDIQTVVAETDLDSQAKAALLRSLSRYYTLGGYLPPAPPPVGGESDDDPHAPKIEAVDNRTHKQSPASDDERRQNQIEAFTQLFGRQPTSTADWTTAAVLDPHTYDAKYQGVESEVRVVKIDPQPDQGVVRVSQWIPQRDVKSGFFSRNFGNDRGPDRNFDPENTKVTTYIDYENGIVVMRQNPSVELDDHGGPGQVRVSEPHGSVTQLADGSVRIKYDAGNPFAPGISTNPNGLFEDHTWTVNGDLVFTPGSDGVHVDGTRTDYPSLEVYQDLPNGSTRTVLIDPAQSGNSNVGPLFNLPFHHDVGVGGKAFGPFDRADGWNPRYDVRVPLPATDFGPATTPPSASPLPRSVGVPA
jgi:hypothetical protein